MCHAKSYNARLLVLCTTLHACLSYFRHWGVHSPSTFVLDDIIRHKTATRRVTGSPAQEQW